MKKIKLLNIKENLLIASELEENLEEIKKEISLKEIPVIKEIKEEFKGVSPLIIYSFGGYFLNSDEFLLKDLYFLEYREKDFLLNLDELINFLKRKGYKIEKNFKEPLKRIKNWTYVKMDKDIEILKRGSLSLYTLEEKLDRKIKISKGYCFNILIVCSGNTCRSPMAKGVLESYLKDYPVFIYSAGVSALTNSSPSFYAQDALKEIGIDISAHKAKQVSWEMVFDADLILCAEKNHCYYLNENFSGHEDKIFLIKGFPNRSGENLIDPIGLDYNVFLKVRDELMVVLKNVEEFLKERFA